MKLTTPYSSHVMPYYVALIGGLIISCLLVLFAIYNSMHSEKENYISRTYDIHDAIFQKVNVANEVIHSISTLFNASTLVDADQFRIFSEDILQRHQYLKSVKYLPQISNQQRQPFEARLREDGFVTFSITEYENDTYKPSSPRSVYFPVLYIEPFTPYSAINMGYDILSNAELEQSVLYAIDTSEVVSTISLTQQTTSEGHYILIKALYTGKSIPSQISERRRSVNALLILELDLKQVFSSIQNIEDISVEVDLTPLSLTNKEGFFNLIKPQITSTDSTPFLIMKSFQNSSTITLPGQRLDLRFNKSLGYKDLNYSNLIYSSLLGLIITILFVVITRRIQGKNEEQQLRNNELRLRKFNSALTDLAKNENLAKGLLNSALLEINETATNILSVERSSIWLHSDDHSYITCADLFERTKDRHSTGLKISASDNPAYFIALNEGRVISADDAHNHLETKDFTENYFIPLGITSMLDAPIRIEGQVIGAVCLEHIGPKRQWSTDEQNFSSSIADMVAMAIQASERRKTELAFRDARDKALLAERTMSIFLANMSHEIRTPLTSIIGFSESLLDTDKTMAERVETIHTVVRSGKHLLQLINNILDISKIEADKLEVENISTSPFEMLADIKALASLHAQEKGLELSLNYNFPLPVTIITDPLRLKQVLINLCNNAIKFTETGSVNVNVSCNAESQQMSFEIMDTGIGLSIEQQDILFTPFNQADNSTTRKYGGTGLGLYLSKQLTEKLGGSIKVSSILHRGSNFNVTIDTGDLKEVDFVDAEPALLKPEDTNLAVNKILQGNVLLAEDNKNNQQLISMYICSTGAKVTIAENGKQAMEKAMSNDFDLILMDVQMPVLDGIEAIKQLRDKGYDKPIVTLTANAYKEDRERCLNAGCNDFLSKPIDRKCFFETLAKYLPETEAASQAENRGPIHSQLPYQENKALADLINNFIGNLRSNIKNLRAAYEEKDMKVLAQRTHDLKGAGGNYGYPQLTEITQKIEFELAKKEDSNISALLHKLDIIYKQINLGKPDQATLTT